MQGFTGQHRIKLIRPVENITHVLICCSPPLCTATAGDGLLASQAARSLVEGSLSQKWHCHPRHPFRACSDKCSGRNIWRGLVARQALPPLIRCNSDVNMQPSTKQRARALPTCRAVHAGDVRSSCSMHALTVVYACHVYACCKAVARRQVALPGTTVTYACMQNLSRSQTIPNEPNSSVSNPILQVQWLHNQ